MSKKTVPARVSGRAGRERPSGSPSKSSPKKAPGFPSDPSRASARPTADGLLKVFVEGAAAWQGKNTGREVSVTEYVKNTNIKAQCEFMRPRIQAYLDALAARKAPKAVRPKANGAKRTLKGSGRSAAKATPKKTKR